MPSTDLKLADANLQRIRQMYPGAVGYGQITGTRHQVTGELRRLEKRGEVIGVRRFRRLDDRTGVVTIPYVRMMDRTQVARQQTIRISGMCVGAGVFLSAVAYLAWQSRYVIGAVAGVLALGAFVFGVLPHWSRGCSGLHCPGCKG